MTSERVQRAIYRRISTRAQAPSKTLSTELMDVCDRLEAQLTAGRAVQAALLEATLRDALQA